MPYATEAQLVIAAGGQQSFDQLIASFDGSLAANVIAQARAAADSWIDGFLRSRYATPVANPSADLQTLSADEAIFRARKWKNAAALTEDHRKDHDERESLLKAMARGEVRPDEPAPAQSTAVAAEFIENSSAVSRSELEGLL